MTLRDFHKAGHTPTLAAAFLYFDVSFMIWVLLGPLGPFIGSALQLSATEKGLMIATPLLAGSFFRPIFGFIADRFGGRRAGMIGMLLTFLPLVIGWRFASELPHFYVVGALLGVAGASFAVALPLAGRWYPPQHQGLAMGIAGAGNSGTLLATLFAPRLATALGWQNVFAIAAIPLCCVFVLFALMAKDSPNRPRPATARDYSQLLQERDTLWFSGLYSVTFGGFVGLASFLTVFFHDQYGVSKVSAGDLTTLTVLAGSFLRPVGGSLADRIGGYRLLLVLLAGVGVLLAGVSTLPSVPVALALLVACMGMLGMGNGAVFQMAPQRFPERIGILTGIVGAAGGIGGFLLPFALGTIKDRTGSYGSGLLLCAAVALCAAVLLLAVGHSWMQTWSSAAAERAGVFSYRRWLRQPSEA